MINMYNQVPQIYTSTSRDFQYLCWLINIVLNSVKHNVDDMYNLPNVKSNSRLTELLAFTLGFKVKRNYDKSQLAALVSILPSILKCKGTKKAIQLAGEALLTSSGAPGSFSDDSCKATEGYLEVTLPKELVDTTLFIDLLPYILPAGMACRIVRKTESNTAKTSEYNYKNVLHAAWTKDVYYNNDAEVQDQDVVGLSAMTRPTDSNTAFGIPSFTNFTSEEENQVNFGLLDNTIIPLLGANGAGEGMEGGLNWELPKENSTDVEENNA